MDILGSKVQIHCGCETRSVSFQTEVVLKKGIRGKMDHKHEWSLKKNIQLNGINDEIHTVKNVYC